jgi:hypothetical protein
MLLSSSSATTVTSDPCLASRDFIGLPVISLCDKTDKFVGKANIEEEAAAKENEKTVAKARATVTLGADSDAEAQCAVAAIYQSAVSDNQKFAHLLGSTAEFAWDKYRAIQLGAKQKDGTMLEPMFQELDFFGTQVQAFNKCLDCRNAIATNASCETPCLGYDAARAYFVKVVRGVSLDQTLKGQGLEVIGNVLKEQNFLGRRVRSVWRQMNEASKQALASTLDLRSRRDAIHQKYRCSSAKLTAPPLAVAKTEFGTNATVPKDIRGNAPSTASVPSGYTSVEPGAAAAALAEENPKPNPIDPALFTKLESATMLITSENSPLGSHGTGFFIETTNPDGSKHYQFVTAAHVPKFGPNDTASVSALEAPLAGGTDQLALSRTYEGQDATWSTVFQKEPGNHRDLDAVKSSAPPGPALEVAKEGDLPQVGEKFVLAGYPESRDASFTEEECSFIGYTSSSNSSDQDYLFNCPAETNGHGSSGGPIVRESDGKVFGIGGHGMGKNNPQSLLAGTPIYQTANGSVEFGAQAQTVQQNCYIIGSSVPHPCTIYPPDYANRRS